MLFGGPIRILVIEDERALARLVQRALSQRGHEVRLAATAAEGRAALAEYEPDLVLLDLELPDQHGLALLRNERDLPPVVIVSGTGTMDEAIEAMRSGTVDYLRKPFSVSDLSLVVDRVIDSARTRRVREVPVTPSSPAEFDAAFRAKVEERASACGLSPRERQVLEMLLLGRTSDEAAAVLQIKPRTVRFHQTNLLEKLGADSRHDLLRVLL